MISSPADDSPSVLPSMTLTVELVTDGDREGDLETVVLLAAEAAVVVVVVILRSVTRIDTEDRNIINKINQRFLVLSRKNISAKTEEEEEEERERGRNKLLPLMLLRLSQFNSIPFNWVLKEKLCNVGGLIELYGEIWGMVIYCSFRAADGHGQR